MTFEVIYRTGGTHYCTWRRIAFKHGSKGIAEEVDKNLERQGYHAEVRTTKELESIGLPVGWTSDAVDWETDEVTVTPYETVHIKRS